MSLMVTDLLILYSPMLRIVIVAVPNDLLPVPEQIILRSLSHGIQRVSWAENQGMILLVVILNFRVLVPQ